MNILIFLLVEVDFILAIGNLMHRFSADACLYSAFVPVTRVGIALRTNRVGSKSYQYGSGFLDPYREKKDPDPI